MLLSDLLGGLGYRGIALRYAENVQLVVFFLNTNRENPAVTMCGAIISVGTMPVNVHGKLAETRTRSPLCARKDFDLNNPQSLAMIDDYLTKMMVKCEWYKKKETRPQKMMKCRKQYVATLDGVIDAVLRWFPCAKRQSSPNGWFWEDGDDLVAEARSHSSREGWWLRLYRR